MPAKINPAPRLKKAHVDNSEQNKSVSGVSAPRLKKVYVDDSDKILKNPAPRSKHQILSEKSNKGHISLEPAPRLIGNTRQNSSISNKISKFSDSSDCDIKSDNVDDFSEAKTQNVIPMKPIFKRLSRSRNWCFTSYAVNDRKWMDDTNIRYYKYGEEICPTTKKLHLQGWMQLKVQKDLNWIKKLNSTDHFEICSGSIDDNEKYVAKNGIIFSKGAIKVMGQRVDLDDVVDKIKDGTYSKFSTSYIKYGGNIEKLVQLKKDEDGFLISKKNFDDNFVVDGIFKSLPRQNKWLSILNGQDNRQILWIFDISGSIGKSTFSDYLEFYHNAISLTNSASRDIAHAYDRQSIVAFDFERSVDEKINYGVIENLKNGKIFSSKYDSKSKRFTKPKIIVFSNFAPDTSKLTTNRWHILIYENNELILELNGMNDNDAKIIKKNKIFSFVAKTNEQNDEKNDNDDDSNNYVVSNQNLITIDDFMDDDSMRNF